MENRRPAEHIAFEETLKRYKGLIFRVCKRYCQRGTTEEDLMQDISVALWRQRERMWAVPEGPKRAAWIWRVATNAAIDTLRRTESHDTLDEGAAADIRAEDHSLVDALYEQIALLDEPDRTLVRLQLAGYSYAEIAVKAEMSEKNVSVRLVRTKQKLREALNR